MGGFADAMVAYVQPLMDATDGNPEQVQRAFMLGQFCWNYAVLPENMREQFLQSMRGAFNMDDEGYEDLQKTVLEPMLQRHCEMFPEMHGNNAMAPQARKPPRRQQAPVRAQAAQKPRVARNAPCPCNSGKKYKRCCGQTR
jgi:hypothetical protein